MRSHAEGHVAAGPGGHAADLGDRRLGHPLQGQATSPTWRIACHWCRRSPLSALPPLRSAPEQNAPPAPVSTTTRSSLAAGDLAERRQQLVPHRPVDRVLLLGPVQRDRDDAAVRPVDLDRLHAGATILAAVGFNPYRRFRARPVDYVLVVVALLAVLALVAWAFLA